MFHFFDLTLQKNSGIITNFSNKIVIISTILDTNL